MHPPWPRLPQGEGLADGQKWSSCPRLFSALPELGRDEILVWRGASPEIPGQGVYEDELQKGPLGRTEDAWKAIGYNGCPATTAS